LRNSKTTFRLLERFTYRLNVVLELRIGLQYSDAGVILQRSLAVQGQKS